MEATKIPDTEIKPMVIRLLKNLMGKMGDVSDNLKNSINKDIETIEKIQTEMMNIISEMKNKLEGINSRLGQAENQI